MPRPLAPPTKQMRMRADLSKMLEVIASEREIPTTELADVLFRGIIEQEYRASVKRLAQTNHQHERKK